MSQRFKKIQNANDESTAYGKWFATAVYGQHFIETEQLADFIQKQASVKRSDIIAVLDELGDAMKHYFELGEKVKLKGIGIFKVGFSSIGTTTKDDSSAHTSYDMARTQCVINSFSFRKRFSPSYPISQAGLHST